MSLSTLRALGFDASKHVPFTGTYSVRCSCCNALVINGRPAHEHGCPHARHECNGCNALIPVRQRYCADCA
jgi:hypothetical protein